MPDTPSIRELQKAVHLAETGKKREAEELCQEIIQKEQFSGQVAEMAARLLTQILPRNSMAFFFYALISQHNNKDEQAITLFEKALVLDKKNVQASFKLTGLLIENGYLKKALEYINHCLFLDPDNKEFLLSKAQVLLNAQEFNRAQETIEKIIEKWGDDNHHVLVALGNIATIQKDNEKALACYLKALEYEREDMRIYYNLGNVYSRLKDFDKTVSYWKEAISLVEYKNKSGHYVSETDKKLVRGLFLALSAFGIKFGKLENCIVYESFDMDQKFNESMSIEGDFLGCLEDVTTFSDEWFIIYESKIYSNFMFHLTKKDRSLKTTSPNGKIVISHHKPVKKYGRPVILWGGADNYYHWICDYLPRLKIIESNTSIKNLPILVNHKWMPYQQQSLELLGFDMSRIEKVPPEHELHFEQLYLPHIPGRPLTDVNLPDWHVPMLTIERVNWLRDVYKDYIRPHKEERRRIFVARKSDMRMCVNEEQVYQVAQKYGFECVDNVGLSFKDQIELYASAEAVMGVHGAGFTNMVFAPRDATLIELYPRNSLPEFYTHMTKLIGQSHIGIEGNIVRKIENMVPACWDFEIDCDELDKKLAKHFGAS